MISTACLAQGNKKVKQETAQVNAMSRCDFDPSTTEELGIRDELPNFFKKMKAMDARKAEFTIDFSTGAVLGDGCA